MAHKEASPLDWLTVFLQKLGIPPSVLTPDVIALAQNCDPDRVQELLDGDE